MSYDRTTTEHLFDSIAPRYDLGNTLLSLGLHNRWNRALTRQIAPDGPLLDLCAGTGAISLSYLERQKRPQTAYLLDCSAQMLARAKTRAKSQAKSCTGPLPHTIEFIHGDAHQIPLPDNSLQTITTAYGLRNLTDPLKCAREVYRTLKPGGTWAILELTRPRNRLLRPLHAIYLKHIVPRLGGFLSSDKQAYQYLSKTVSQFISPEELVPQLCQSGLTHNATRPLTGGIATIIILQK